MFLKFCFLDRCNKRKPEFYGEFDSIRSQNRLNFGGIIGSYCIISADFEIVVL